MRIRDFGAGLLPAVYSETCRAEHEFIEHNKKHVKVCGGKVNIVKWKGVCEVCGESAKNLIGGVFKFFGHYGASDKRETNKLIGSMGIGCKSAFSYTDAFSVISHIDKQKFVFSLYKDEKGAGKVAVLTEQPTTEKNGLEIVVPVKREDVSTFVNKGYEIVKYLKTKPALKGVNNPPSFERVEPALTGTFWKYFGDSRETIVIQGQIGYPIDTDKVGQTHYGTGNAPKGYIAEWERDLLNSGLELEVNIGEVEVTASREALQMSDYTIAAIRKRLSEVKTEIQDYAAEKLKFAKTMIEAKTAYYELFMKGGSFGYRMQSSLGEIKWNGTIIKDNVIHLDEALHKVIQYTKRRNGNITLTTFDKIKCSDSLNLYFDDTNRKTVMYRRRAKTLLDGGAEQVTVIQTEDAKALKKTTGIDVTKLPQYSTVTPTILNTTRGGGNGIDITKRAKHQVNVFVLDTDKLLDNYTKGSNSDYWKVASIIPDKQVYIPIERFIPQEIEIVSLVQLRTYLLKCKNIGAEIKIPIYGLKAKQDAGNMVKFDVFLKEHISKIPNLADEAALITDFVYSLTNLRIAVENLPDGSIAKQYKQLWSEAYELCGKQIPSYYNTDSTNNAATKKEFANFAGLTSNRKDELKKLAELFEKTYPLIKKISISSYGTVDVPLTIAMTEYVQLVFEAREK